ncbi:zinc-binding dehydrogenase [Streptomyces fulvoviolaceus]|uniref:zinc-binding dehydrogenase n=1 Tax=Streptomyces fulvoviolaceus TaxID=285535 RepID=UPI0004C6B172|nr:zinc-binding dehydrogenase [Streptomyces fulvoviolaceus]MCT9083686.1 zinc-binding dehydrogenase [Streptomyces fulvoviolaceus]
MSDLMRAIVLDAPGPPQALTVRRIPVPAPVRGEVLIQVKAFGLNRSELYTRLGLSGDAVTFPRVPGIEAVGIVAACPGGEFDIDHQVAALMGGMGRTFDGGYAEYTCVPARQVVPFDSTLDWGTLGAVPEMLQTAHGCLTLGLDARPGQSLLIRGGTSSVGLTAAVLAARRGMTVLSTTRRAVGAALLRRYGAEHALVDDGDVAAQVRDLLPEGVDTALELVGTPTLRDTLLATRVHGVVCYAGALSLEWTVRDFVPNSFIPHGVRLTGYGGDAHNLPADVLQSFLDDVQEGRVRLPVGEVFPFHRIADAHAAMEAGTADGKLVVTV